VRLFVGQTATLTAQVQDGYSIDPEVTPVYWVFEGALPDSEPTTAIIGPVPPTGLTTTIVGLSLGVTRVKIGFGSEAQTAASPFSVLLVNVTIPDVRVVGAPGSPTVLTQIVRCSASSLTIAGQDISLPQHIPCAPAALTVAGQAASVPHVVPCAPATLTIAGQAASLPQVIPCVPATLTVAGLTASIS
jgi:hypothetical protein